MTRQDKTRQDKTRQDKTRQDKTRQPIVRNSSLELLRIVAMFPIVACHFSQHGGFNFPIDSLTLNRLYQQFLYMGGQLCNDIFVMISGYFLVNSERLDFRKLFNLWVRIFFYSVTLYSTCILSGMRAFEIKDALKAVMPIISSIWWFASTYFVMYLIHPYINVMLRSFRRDDYKKFLTAIMIYWCVIPTITTSSFQGNNLISFICIYSLAGYIRLWADDFGSKKFILYGLPFIALNFISVIVFDVIGMRFSYFEKKTMYMIEMMRPFTILAALCIFIGFKKLNIQHNIFINTIASATFSVYLIHENRFVNKFIWQNILKSSSFQDSVYLIPYSIAVIILVYVSCTLIELIRSKIFKVISRGMLS